MIRIFLLVSVFVVASTLAWAGDVENTMPEAKPEATALDLIKQLEGSWEMKDKDGKTELATIFLVSSSGSVVREIMFPGGEHEMTNMYHMDGDALVMTHYCAVGNQPHLRAVSAKPGLVEMKTHSVSNRATADEPYMSELTLRLQDKDTLIQEWRSQGGDKPETAVFEMKRKPIASAK